MLDQLHGPECERAWSWFLDTYRSFVLDFASRRLDRARANEFCDAVWGTLLMSGATKNADRARRFRGYLVGILKNQIRHFDRKDRRGTQRSEESEDLDETLDTDSLTHEAESQDLRSWASATLARAMDELGKTHPRDRSLLTEFYGLDSDPATPEHRESSASDIASRLQIAPNAVHQAMFKARRRLREQFVEIVRQTVATQSDFEEELDTLIASLGDRAPGLLDA